MSASSSQTEVKTPGPQSFQGAAAYHARLRAETLRLHEQSFGEVDGAGVAEAVARETGGDFENRILVRAERLDAAVGLTQALAQVRGAVRVATAVLLIAAALGGAGAVQAAMVPGSGNVVNFFALVIATLGLATVMLLAWILVAVAGGGRTGLAGALVAGVTSRIITWSGGGPVQISALRASAAGLLGRWNLGAVTHATWLVFLVAGLANALFLLSTRSYVFVWETTILSADAYVALVRWLAAVPSLFGFSAPGPEEVRASEWIGSGEAAAVARDAWANLFVGALVVYGIVPRVLLLGLCLAVDARWRERFRLDTADPDFAMLEQRLMPRSQASGFADSESGVDPDLQHVRHGPTSRRIAADPLGPVAVLGLEIAEPATGWPPPFGASPILDLGLVDSRESLKQALDLLRHAQPAPRFIIVFCALTAVPDRGILAHLDHIEAIAAIPIGIVLTGGQAMRQRGDLRTRIADWRTLARQAGIADDRMVEVDLDHLTEASRSKLGAFAGEPGESHDDTNRLGRAFTVIRTSVEGWREAPDAETQAELHRRIARLYRGEGDGWHRIFDPRTINAGNLAARLKTGADMFIGALPGRLAADRRWLAAGAAAGALGCVAAATLAVPGAIAGLPLWAGLGAALAATIRDALRATGSPEAEPPEIADAVRAATLFALVLEAQGHEETAITRMIDDAVGDEATDLNTEARVAEWLDRVHMRYRDAERREAAR